MAEPAVPQLFEQAMEADINRLALEVKNQEARPEMKDVRGDELVKEAIRAFPELKREATEGGAAENTGGASAASSSSVSASSAASPLPDYAQSSPSEVKLEIEYLLDIALREGIGKALSASRKSPYFVQDAFHDALTGRLYPELKRRGVVK